MEAEEKFIAVEKYRSPYGDLEIGTYNGKLVLCDWCCSRHLEKNKMILKKRYGIGIKEEKNPLLEKSKNQLDEYFAGKRRIFDIPIEAIGTEFQQKVWKELTLIPYGQTITYKKLAERVGNPKAVRAVANANSRNRIAIIVPCHRVVSMDGMLGGYTAGVDVKARILDREAFYFWGNVETEECR